MQSATFAPLVTRNASGSSAGMRLRKYDKTVALLLNCTATTGATPSMTVTAEWSHDGTTWFSAEPTDTFNAMTAPGKVAKTFAVKGRHVRASWVITGTLPTFTFALEAVAY